MVDLQREEHAKRLLSDELFNEAFDVTKRRFDVPLERQRFKRIGRLENQSG